MKRQLFVMMIIAASLTTGRAEQTVQTEAATPVTGSPKIQFDKMVYDFGSTSLVQQLAGTFVISNAGSAMLSLGKPTTSCGCTVAALSTNQLAPGEKTELGFTMSVNMPRGHAEKSITVPSNDTNMPSAKLIVKADIVPVFDYSPQILQVGNLHIGATNNLVVQIKRIDGKPMGISGVEAKSAFIHPQIDPVEGATNAVVLRVQVAADGIARMFNDTISVMGEAGGRPLFMIPISGRIVGDIVLQPPQLVWGIPDPDHFPGPQGPAAATRIVTVSPGANDQKLELSNLTCSIPELKVTLNPSEDGKSFKITAVIDKVPKESVSGAIRFEANIKRQPVVEIPVAINVLRHN